MTASRDIHHILKPEVDPFRIRVFFSSECKSGTESFEITLNELLRVGSSNCCWESADGKGLDFRSGKALKRIDANTVVTSIKWNIIVLVKTWVLCPRNFTNSLIFTHFAITIFHAELKVRSSKFLFSNIFAMFNILSVYKYLGLWKFKWHI